MENELTKADPVSLLHSRSKKQVGISVIGDAMIDQYFFVKADRVSPEFPIPVLTQSRSTPLNEIPGGAGNVCMQFKPWNVNLNFFGLLNPKASGVYETCGLDTRHCVVDKKIVVPEKRRYYQGDFPLCRLDLEYEKYGLTFGELRKYGLELLDKITKVSPSDVYVLSDYGKGLFTEEFCKKCFEYFEECGKFPITVVDPKRGPISKWRGCSIIKPNAKEAEYISGMKDWEDQVNFFMDETGCQSVIITQEGRGVVGSVMGRQFEYYPGKEVKAESVIGAGDCFIATIALCMAHGLDVLDAIELAFEAGHIYVQRKYNKPVHPYELGGDFDPATLANRDFTLAFTNGCFDILHAGHIEMLKFAKSKADKLVVALNTDESVMRQGKNHLLVNTLEHRKKIISALECVDFAVVFDEVTPYNLIKSIKPDVLIKGEEYTNPVGSDLVNDVYLAPMVEGISTTGIIKKIKGSQ